MNAGGLLCPDCESPVSAVQSFCPNCGASLTALSEVAPSARPAAPGADSWDWVGVQDDRGALPRAQERTKTGLLLMIVAFALLWIPFVSSLGELIALIGVVFLWLGRNGFDPSHSRNVLLGGACVVLGLLIAIGVGIWFAGAIVAEAASPGQSLSQLGTLLQSDLGVLFVVGLATAGLTAIAYVLLPYALSDPTSRILLFSAAVLTVAISAIQVAVLFPQISNAVAQATSGSSINTGPITALQDESVLLATAQILPDMMFLWAYYRTRARTFPNQPSGAGPTGTSGRFGRVG